MGDIGDYWREHREYRRSRGLPARSSKPPAKRVKFRASDAKAGWRQCSEWHWQRRVAGDLLDYWPSKDKWRWRGETTCGSRGALDRFIKAQEARDAG